MSKVTDFYDDPDDFEADLDSARMAAVTEREMDFISGLRDKFEEWGAKMFLSDSQHAWLQRIIDGAGRIWMCPVCGAWNQRVDVHNHVQSDGIVTP